MKSNADKAMYRINKADAFKKLKSQNMLTKKRPGNSTWILWLPMPTSDSISDRKRLIVPILPEYY